MKSNYGLAVLSVFLAAIFWGLAPSAAKIALKEIPPFSLIFFRFLLASIFVFPFFLKAKKNFKGELLHLSLFSLLIFLNIIFFTFGIRLTNASISSVLYAGTPLLVSFFSWLLFKEKISLSKIIGIIIGLVGVFIIIILPVLSGKTAELGDILGNGLITVGVFCFTFYTLLAKFILKKHSPLVATSLNFFVIALLSFPLAGFELINNSGWLGEVSLQGLMGLFYLAIFASVGSYFLYQWGLKKSSPIEASINFYIQPIVGSLVVLSGVFLTTTLSYLKKGKTVIK